MKLGTQTASVINHLSARATIGQPAPVAGMGCTLLHWTDRSPATIFRVFKVGKATVIETRADKYSRVDTNGMSESQDYEYKTNVNGGVHHFRNTDANGRWEEVRKNEVTGRWNKTGGCGLRIGSREKYHDFSF